MIHNYIFFLQAKLDYMIENHSAAGKEVLIVVVSAQELFQEGGVYMVLNQYAIAAIAAKIVSKFDGNFYQKANLKCKTTKNNIISSYKEDYFFDRKIREDRVLDNLDRLFQN